MGNLFSQGGDTAEQAARAEAGVADMVDDAGPPRMEYAVPASRIDARLFPFDAAQAAREPVYYGATSNRKLTVYDASDQLGRLMRRHQVDKKIEGVQMAFLRAMLLCHAKNSASVLTPDRANFYIGKLGQPGTVKFNYYLDVVDVLGDDTRRFFRAYADVERSILRELMARRGSMDPDVLQDIADIDWVAADRGLSRYPDLCFDSSEACSGLTAHVRTVLANSKASILSKTVNVVDRQNIVRAAQVGSLEAAKNDGSAGDAGGPEY